MPQARSSAQYSNFGKYLNDRLEILSVFARVELRKLSTELNGFQYLVLDTIKMTPPVDRFYAMAKG